MPSSCEKCLEQKPTASKIANPSYSTKEATRLNGNECCSGKVTGLSIRDRIFRLDKKWRASDNKKRVQAGMAGEISDEGKLMAEILKHWTTSMKIVRSCDRQKNWGRRSKRPIQEYRLEVAINSKWRKTLWILMNFLYKSARQKFWIRTYS